MEHTFQLCLISFHMCRDMRNRTSTSRRLACHRKEPHGVKRGQASSWEEGGAHGRSKHPHIDEFCATPHCYQSPANSVTPAGPFRKFAVFLLNAKIKIWDKK